MGTPTDIIIGQAMIEVNLKFIPQMLKRLSWGFGVGIDRNLALKAHIEYCRSFMLPYLNNCLVYGALVGNIGQTHVYHKQIKQNYALRMILQKLATTYK